MSDVFHSATALSRGDGLAELVAPFGSRAADRVSRAIAGCPVHRATPLLRLTDLAREWGVREIFVKDERARLGLRSFKAIGGAYAVLCIAARAVSQRLGATSIGDLLREPRPVFPEATFTAATAGNHGCSVAAGARLVGARCRIFVPDGVPAEQLRAIAEQGAEIVPVAGGYEDALQACSGAAEQNGWIAVPDCASEPHDATVAFVMEGYTLIAAELLDAGAAPTHAFLQAGVGGMAAAIGAHFAAVLGERAPTLVVVEPETAACLQASARADRAVEIRRGAGTNMGRLECYAPSAAAWPLLRALASAYATVTDAQAQAACELLARHQLATTPSGAAGLAGLGSILESPADRDRLGLGKESDVVLIVTEAPLREPIG
jgi:diaminopropionate ammonia-lyase